MSVRFDPRIISEEEQAAIRRPSSSGLPIGSPDAPRATAPQDSPAAPPQYPPADNPQADHVPPPPTDDFPRPPSSPPPMRRGRRDVTLPFRPSS